MGIFGGRCAIAFLISIEACGAGVSVKPGAQAPGKDHTNSFIAAIFAIPFCRSGRENLECAGEARSAGM